MKITRKFALIICLLLGACVPSEQNIYVINLDRTPDRYKKVKEKFDKQKVHCNRWIQT